MENNMNAQSGKELLKKAIEQWLQDGVLDSFAGDKSSSGKKLDGIEEDLVLHNLENDPVINLFMTALAHQTNLLKEQIAALRTALLDEMLRKTVPFALTRPVPAMSVLRAKMVESSEPSCVMDDSSVILLEKRGKTKMRFKELEKFSFLPLFKTKILNATIKSVRRIARNTFELTLSRHVSLHDLSGVSLFFPNSNPISVSLSKENTVLPIISVRDVERLPLCDSFDVNHCLFNRSLLYGTTESWLDMMSPFVNKLFYVGDYEYDNVSAVDTLQMTLSTPDDIELSTQDILINCVPIVNVEKNAVSLSLEEPIKRIATEKMIDIQGDTSSEKTKKAETHKSFLHLLQATDPSFGPENITIRHYGAERFHVGELLQQTRALVHRYSSDYYAFRTFADVDFDDKMNILRTELNEIEKIVGQDNEVHSGVYVMLQKRSQEYFTGGQKRVAVSYLLTDGQRANDISPGNTMLLPPMLDAAGSSILMPTFGGAEEVSSDETLRMTARYYQLTKERLVTKSDIKYFCMKELMSAYHIPKDAVKTISVFQDSHADQPVIVVRILLCPSQELGSSGQHISTELQQKIGIRTTGFSTYKVQIEVE